MLYWTIKISIISIIFILIVHNILYFLRDTLTIPKIRDLVNTPNEKYERIYNIINNNETTISQSINPNGTTSIDSIPLINDSNTTNPQNITISPQTKETMKNELKNFMKTHIKTPSNSTPQYMPL